MTLEQTERDKLIMINQKNVVEQSRTEVHDSDIRDRDEIHEDDTAQIKILSKKLDKHIIQNLKDSVLNDQHYKSNATKIDKLLPLVGLIPSIEEIVENQRAMTLVGRKVLKVITVISIIIGVLIGILELWKRVK